MDAGTRQGIDLDGIGHGIMLLGVLALFTAAGLKLFGFA